MRKVFKNVAPTVVGMTLAILISIPLGPKRTKSNFAKSTLVNDTYSTQNSSIKDTPSTTESPVTNQESTFEQVDENHDIISSEFNNIPMTEQLKLHIKKMCDFYEFEEELVYQIIYCESRYNPCADNGLCKGLMQLNKNYVSSYAEMNDGAYEIKENYDIFDPYTNIVLGLRCLSDWRRMGTSQGYSDISDWLSFYNMGWSYKSKGPNGYANSVLSTDIRTINFSNYEIIG